MDHVKRMSTYDKSPRVAIPGSEGACVAGWEAIGARLREAVRARQARRTVVVVDA